MNIIKPNVELLDQKPGLEGIYKQIEIAGRTCYKSDHLIKEGSAEVFTKRMMEYKHYAMLEHGTVYLELPCDSDRTPDYQHNKYSRVVMDGVGYAITTNLRVLIENGWMDDLQYLCDSTEHHIKRLTFRFTTQVAITREANRHRVNSMAEQSTRYCNYNKDKFGGELSISLPTWVEELDPEIDDYDYLKEDFLDMCHVVSLGENQEWNALKYWWFANLSCEYSYMNMIKLEIKPEQARTILPLDLNTELIHTAFEDDWKHFCDLRCDSHAHPDIQVLANKVLINLKIKQNGKINK